MIRHLLVTQQLQQAILDKAEYRVNHDATFVLATFDSPLKRIPGEMFIPHLSILSFVNESKISQLFLSLTFPSLTMSGLKFGL